MINKITIAIQRKGRLFDSSKDLLIKSTLSSRIQKIVNEVVEVNLEGKNKNIQVVVKQGGHSVYLCVSSDSFPMPPYFFFPHSPCQKTCSQARAASRRVGECAIT